MSLWEVGNLGVLAKDLGWWELQKYYVTQTDPLSALTLWRDLKRPSAHLGKNVG